MRLQRFSEKLLWLSEARPALKMLCQKMSRRRERLYVIGLLGAIGCRGASKSEQLDSNFAERILVFWAPSSWPANSSSTTILWYVEFKV